MGLANLEGRPLTIGITTSCGLGFMLFGYDQGVFGGLLANPSLLEQFNYPGTTMQGQIVSTYTVGCIVGAIFSVFMGDILGRKRLVVLGCLFLTVGGLLQATAFTIPHMIVGRVIGGLGIGCNTTAIPLWQSETSHPRLRGKLVALQLTFLVFGFVITNWMNFGFTYVTHNQVSWRFPLGFQSALAIGTAMFVPFLVESPRWLCLKDRKQEAQVVISRLLKKPIDDEEVNTELHLILESIAREREESGISWRQYFRNGKQQAFRRLLLGIGINAMQQLGGVNLVAYYLPVVLERSFGFSPRMSLILSACDSMQWMFWAAMAMWTIEKFGRIKMLLFGAAGQVLCYSMMAIGLGIGSKAMNGVAVAFIFIYYFFYGLSFLAIPFLYPSEINPNHSRNVGAGAAMLMNWIGVYIVVSITPIGIESIGWRFYLVFAAVNLAWIPIIYFFYVETAGLSLDEIDRLFEIKHTPGSGLTYKQATVQAKEEIEAEKIRFGHISPEKEKMGSDHVEEV